MLCTHVWPSTLGHLPPPSCHTPPNPFARLAVYPFEFYELHELNQFYKFYASSRFPTDTS